MQYIANCDHMKIDNFDAVGTNANLCGIQRDDIHAIRVRFHQLHISVQQFESDRGKIMFALGALVISLVLVLH